MKINIRSICRWFGVQLVGLGLLLLGAWSIPHRWCEQSADRWLKGDIQLQQSLARDVEQSIDHGIKLGDFSTGSDQFNGEWLFGTYLMAGLGFGQIAVAHPETKENNVRLMSVCIDRLLTPEVRAFDRLMWNSDPIETLDGDEAHVAYLGYLNLLLSFHRWLDPHSSYARLNDKISYTLIRRMNANKHLLLESYPDEAYPMDNCAAIGSIGLWDRATGLNHAEFVDRWIKYCRLHYCDPKTKLFYQAVSPWNGCSVDNPRGSGSALGTYFISFADPVFAGELYGAIKKHLAGTFLGFGAVREYPHSIRDGKGDIDSGPIVFGYGLSATGFTIASSRIFGDAAYFRRLCGSAYLAGAPLQSGESLTFVTGGPLGNAILLAMLTALPQEVWK